ncbi:hypothetical protein [Mycobacterium sp.]|uniref:hypothetical protein n=1 Tax=Mycobacterium sp. TaxID=1785 RepID=UPI0031D85E17
MSTLTPRAFGGVWQALIGSPAVRIDGPRGAPSPADVVDYVGVAVHCGRPDDESARGGISCS